VVDHCSVFLAGTVSVALLWDCLFVTELLLEAVVTECLVFLLEYVDIVASLSNKSLSDISNVRLGMTTKTAFG